MLQRPLYWNSVLLTFPCVSFDSSIGRFEKASLPQQALMELVLEKIIRNKSKIYGDTVDMKPLAEWKQVTLNEKGEVTQINWAGFQLDGTISLEWLPETLEELSLELNFFKGTLNTAILPAGLTKVDLSEERMTGSVDLDSLRR